MVPLKERSHHKVAYRTAPTECSLCALALACAVYIRSPGLLAIRCLSYSRVFAFICGQPACLRTARRGSSVSKQSFIHRLRRLRRCIDLAVVRGRLHWRPDPGSDGRMKKSADRRRSRRSKTRSRGRSLSSDARATRFLICAICVICGSA